jgi:hypothetical protein
LVRGDFRTKGEPVTPGTPAVLPPLQAGPANRLALARWLVARENPLMARVTVNRYWSVFFGTGLVKAITIPWGDVATAYRTIRPRLNEAYKSLGQTESSVDVAVQQALDLLIATPIPSGPIALIEGKGATWAFADPELEALPAAQKHLLRMGPRNASKVVQALVQVRQRVQP